MSSASEPESPESTRSNQPIELLKIQRACQSWHALFYADTFCRRRKYFGINRQPQSMIPVPEAATANTLAMINSE